MDTTERQQIEAVIDLCHDARNQLPADASFRLRVLLDMALVELDKEIVRLADSRAA